LNTIVIFRCGVQWSLNVIGINTIRWLQYTAWRELSATAV